jgi:effector-binding domain-containing protein
MALNKVRTFDRRISQRLLLELVATRLTCPALIRSATSSRERPPGAGVADDLLETGCRAVSILEDADGQPLAAGLWALSSTGRPGQTGTMNETDSGPANEPEIITLPATTVAVVHDVVPMSEISDFFGRAFQTVSDTLDKQGIAITGPPIGVYFGMPADTVEVAAGFPTAQAVTAEDEVVAETLPGGQVAQVMHVGSYDSLQQSYGRLMAWLESQNLRGGTVMWESYLTEPGPGQSQDTMLTRISWPLAA